MVDFASWKKKSSGSLANLIEKASSEQTKGSKQTYESEDNRFWTLSRDKLDNGFAIIRFLPSKNPEDNPWTMYHHHSIRKDQPGKKDKWFIETCPSTLGAECPACHKYFELWKEGNAGNKLAKERAGSIKRKTSYNCNILVVMDTKNAENNGKVFLFKYGAKIHKKIIEAMTPPRRKDSNGVELPEKMQPKPINPFDIFEGRDFELSSANVDGYVNYDKSKFADQPSPIADSEEAMKQIFDSIFDLKEWTDPSKFKSFEALTETFNKFENGEDAPVQRAEDEEIVKPAPKAAATKPAITEKPAAVAPKPPVKAPVVQKEEDDGSPGASDADIDNLDYYKTLAESEE